MSKNKRSFSNVLAWFLVFILAVPVIGGILYFTVPKFKEFADEKLKIEQSKEPEVETDKENAELVAGLKEEIATNKQVISNLNSELEKQRVEVTKLQNEAKSSEELIKTLQTNIASKQTELESVISEKEALEEREEELRLDVNAKISEIENLRANILTKEESINELEADIQTKQTELENLRNEANADAETIASLEADIQAKQSTLESLQLQAEEDNQTIINLQNDISEMEAELSELKENADADAETIASLEANIQEKQNLVNELQTIKTNNETTIASLQTEVSNKQTTINNLQTEVSNKQSTIDSLNVTITEKNNLISELEAQAEEDAERLESLETAYINSQTYLEQARADINTKDAQIIQLSEDIDLIEAERDSLQESITLKNNEIITLQGNITSLENSIVAKESEIASLNNQIQVLEDALNKDDSKIYLGDLMKIANDIGTTLTYKKISDYEYFVFSSNASGLGGVYVLNTLDNSITNIISSTDKYSVFNMIENVGCLISSSSLNNVYFYEYATRETTELSIKLRTLNLSFVTSSGKIYVASNALGSLYKFDIDNKELIVVDSTSRVYLNQACEIGNGKILSSNNSSSNPNLILINSKTDEVELIEATNYSSLVAVGENDALLIKQSDGSLCCFNGESKTIVSLNGGSYNLFYKIDENKILVRDKSNYFHLYNHQDKSITALEIKSSSAVYYYNLLNGDALIYEQSVSQSSCPIYLFNNTDNTLVQISSNLNVASITDFGSYIKLVQKNTGYERYYILGTSEIVSEKPVIVNFVSLTQDGEGNVSSGEYGKPVVSPSALKVNGSIELTESGAIDGYYLSGIYADLELTNLVVDWLSGETAINYSDVSSLIDTETNTLTLYAVFMQSDSNSNPGQSKPGFDEGGREE